MKLWKWLIHYNGQFRVYKMIPGLLGMQSICEDGKHVLFLDFDHTTKKSVKEVCKKLSGRNEGTYYIFESSRNHYHVVCLSKFTFGEVADIQLELGMQKYLRFAALRGFWVLRVSPKKSQVKYLETIHGDSFLVISRPHYELLKRLYPDIEYYGTFDAFKRLMVDVYASVTKD